MGELTGSISSGVGFQESEGLIARLKERDEQAFAEVFHLYKDLIYTLVLKLLSDKTEAMDVTQEVFLTLYRKIFQFRGECRLKTWLYRVACNQVANRNRWWRRRYNHRTERLGLVPKADGALGVDPPGGDPWPERAAFSKEIQRALQDGLSRLPFEQRTAVVLRDVQGLSYEEIAEITDVEVGTIKSRIARGRETLQEFMKGFRRGARL